MLLNRGGIVNLDDEEEELIWETTDKDDGFGSPLAAASAATATPIPSSTTTSTIGASEPKYRSSRIIELEAENARLKDENTRLRGHVRTLANRVAELERQETHQLPVMAPSSSSAIVDSATSAAVMSEYEARSTIGTDSVVQAGDLDEVEGVKNSPLPIPSHPDNNPSPSSSSSVQQPRSEDSGSDDKSDDDAIIVSQRISSTVQVPSTAPPHTQSSTAHKVQALASLDFDEDDEEDGWS